MASYKVLLSKVGWCIHCRNFLPIFNESKVLIKNSKLKNVNIEFEIYDMDKDKGIFDEKYEVLSDKVKGYPTVFLVKIENDKLAKNVEIGHAKNPDDFIELINNAYLKLSPQTGGNQKEEIYKQKYLKYKAKYLQYKSQKGGIICENCENPCEKVRNPIFTFDTRKIVKYPAFLKSIEKKSLYKLFLDKSCTSKTLITLQSLLDNLNINQIFDALVELLKDYEVSNKKKFNHFNQLLLLLIIRYLQKIEDHLIVSTDTKRISDTLNQIKEIIDVNTGWCVKEKEKLKCGDKDVSVDLDQLLQNATLLFLKNYLRNLKDDEASVNFFIKNKKISEDNLNYLACLCAQIIIEHYKSTGNYNIPLLVIIVKVETRDFSDSFNRLNSLLSKILSEILKCIDSKLTYIFLGVFEKNKNNSEYKESIDKISGVIQGLPSNLVMIEDKKNFILTKMKEERISDTFIPFINKIVSEILDEINNNYRSLPQILYFLYQTFLKNSVKGDNRRDIFYYNTYYLRYINKVIIDLVLQIPDHHSSLVGRVIQKLIASLTQDKTTAINVTILFNYTNFREIMDKINKQRDIPPNPDVFNKELNCTFPKKNTILSELSFA